MLRSGALKPPPSIFPRAPLCGHMDNSFWDFGRCPLLLIRCRDFVQRDRVFSKSQGDFGIFQLVLDTMDTMDKFHILWLTVFACDITCICRSMCWKLLILEFCYFSGTNLAILALLRNMLQGDRKMTCILDGTFFRILGFYFRMTT